MKLSLCMIVRNEEACLERCLSSARPHVDEIVIVDTGSTDKTVEIAGKYANILTGIEWPDSFSAARNHSMSLANGEYILILDADEYIPDAESWASIRMATEAPGLVAGHLSVLNTMSGALIEGERVQQPRILLNHPLMRYKGRVHNQIGPAILRAIEETGGTQARVGAEIVHDGYDNDDDAAAAKYTERIPLLLMQIGESRDAEEVAYYQYQLASMLHVLNRFVESCEIWDQIDYKKLDDHVRLYAHYVASKDFRAIGENETGAPRMNAYAQAFRHANAMMGINSAEPAPYFLAGILLMETGNAREGTIMLQEALIRSYMPQPGRRFEMNKLALLDNIALAYEYAGDMAAMRDVQGLSVENALPVIRELQARFVEVDAEVLAC